MRYLIVGLALIAIASLARGATAQDTLSIPGAPVVPLLLDGQVAPVEWAGARVAPVGGTVRLLAKEMGGDVFLALVTGDRLPRPVDVYLQLEDGTLWQLHASAQIGERLLPASGWSDTVPAWRWGNHLEWLANEAKVDAQRGREGPITQRMFEADGVEFQIRRSRFGGQRWRIRVDVGAFPGNVGTFRLPSAATDDPATWATVLLPAGGTATGARPGS